MKQILAIGCGGAGMFSSIVATQLKPGKFKATILSDEGDIYCRCTSPYILTDDATLKEAVQPECMITDFGVELVHEQAVSIDTKKRIVMTDKHNAFKYDYLVLGMGASAFVPPIKNAEHPDVHTIRKSDDLASIAKATKKGRKKVCIVGGGVIGIEMAGALRENGHDVSIIESTNRLISGICDEEFSEHMLAHLKKNKIDVHFSSLAKEVLVDNKHKVKGLRIAKDGKESDVKADIVILAAGVRANLDVVKNTPIKHTNHGILVNDKMQTNIKNIYAAGDCCLPISAVTGENIPGQLASNAIQQSKIVGYQIAGFPIKYAGTTNAFAFQSLDVEYAQSGLSEEKARQKYKWVVTGQALTTDIYRDMKEKHELRVKLIFAGPTLKLVGAEAFGKGTISHIETASYAIVTKSNIMDLLKYNYVSHPSLTPWPFMNPIIMASEDAMGKVMQMLKKKLPLFF